MINRLKQLIRRKTRKQSKQAESYIYEVSYTEKGLLDGKVVVVTGATGAIGSGICFELAVRGARVGVCGRNKEKIDCTIASMVQLNPSLSDSFFPLCMDLCDEESIEKGFQDFDSLNLPLDGFINNAGGEPGRVGDATPYLWDKKIEQIDLQINTNLRGTILCSCQAAKRMVPRQAGIIINMGSVIGLCGKAGMSDYAAAKSGIIGFSKSLALELAPFNVRCNCITPGLINQIPFEEGSGDIPTQRTPLGRKGTTREIGETAAFMIQNEYLTGENVVVDGGRSLGLFGDN